jgi:hypothetical protein
VARDTVFSVVLATWDIRSEKSRTSKPPLNK